MRLRQLVVVATVLAAGAGAFFAGRAIATRRPPEPQVSNVSAFQPLSVSFVSPSVGFALGTAPCNNRLRCLVLLEATGQLGATWKVLSIPDGLATLADRDYGGRIAAVSGTSTLTVRFANARDGWIFGSLKEGGFGATAPVLWATHDGGTTWANVPLPWAAGTVFDLEASRGTARLMAPTRGGTVRIESTSVATDAWRISASPRLDLPSGGGPATGAFTLAGATGWLVEGNDRGTTGSARLAGSGTWERWSPPCASVGDSLAVPEAVTTADLVVVCTIGGYAHPVSPSAPPGATLGSNWLYYSVNGGTSFEYGPELVPTALPFEGLLASPSPATVFFDRGTPHGSAVLVASFDRGMHFQVVLGQDATSLSFVSRSLAIGLTTTATGTTTSMIRTTDGGRQWETVTY